MTADHSRDDDDRVHAETPAEGDPDADPGDIYDAGLDALRRWRHEAERPDKPHAERTAAHVVVRSTEGLLALFA